MADKLDVQEPEKPGAMLFMIAFCLISVVLVLYLGDQTKFSAKGKFFAQPRVWPAVGVIGMAAFSAAYVLQRIRVQRTGEISEAFLWLRGLEYVAWFMIYVWAVPRVGYLPTTVIFAIILAFRVGYRETRTLIAAGATGFAIVLVFKTFLGVKIPGGAIYEYLPTTIRNFFILNF
ncbi:MAG: tripartite tricarboxylate transporter TctB family protein [Pseudomonadota bacterium]